MLFAGIAGYHLTPTAYLRFLLCKVEFFIIFFISEDWYIVVVGIVVVGIVV